jgi:hypothetical protein
MGQPNANGNTALKPVDAGFLNTPINNFETSSGVINNPNPSYSNTIGNISGQPTPLPSPNMSQPNMGGIAGGVENNYRGIAGLVNPVARMPGIDSFGGQPQNPMGGGNFVQTGQFGSQPIDMGGFGGNMGGGFGGNMGGQLTPLPSPNMPQPYMPGIDSFGGQPQVGGPAQLMGGMDRPAIGMPGGEGGKTTFSQPRGKGGGGGQGGGKGSTATGSRLVDFPQLANPYDSNMAGKAVNDPMPLLENTYHPGGYQGPGSSY